MIDTRNGGQPCTECAHYKENATRMDRLFGAVPVHRWCGLKNREVENKKEGFDCPVFEKRTVDC